ncbi:hypothetical protein DQF64_00495 [Moraxella bovis]|nr:hypothetical protein DQF64_00495 [Moraxella bovis]
MLRKIILWLKRIEAKSPTRQGNAQKQKAQKPLILFPQYTKSSENQTKNPKTRQNLIPKFLGLRLM